MIIISNTEVSGWEAAIRGMRNPLDSWDKSDAVYKHDQLSSVGLNNLDLMRRLALSGTDHGKFLRYLTVTCDIYAPFYWWKQFDTYKVGTVANSCSTMHRIHSKPFSIDDFSHEKMTGESLNLLKDTVNLLNYYRKCYNESHDKSDWWQLIQLLPSSYNQLRTVQMNYQNIHFMVESRKAHKLDEWHDFCDWAHELPHYNDIFKGESNEG